MNTYQVTVVASYVLTIESDSPENASLTALLEMNGNPHKPEWEVSDVQEGHA